MPRPRDEQRTACHFTFNVCRSDRTAAEVHNNLGAAYASLGRLPEASACYRQALRLKPDYADALNNLGLVQAVEGHWDQALDCYYRALALRQNHPETWCNLGIAHIQQSHLDEAVRCFRQALALRSHYADALNYLGNALLCQGKWVEAGACYRQFLELRPNDAGACNNLALIYLRLRQWQQAADLLQKSLASDPGNPRTQRNLGKLYVDQGNYAAALPCYQRLLELCPGDVVAQFQVEALSGQSALAKPSAEYMAALYDERAAHFDLDPVERLGYCSPALLQAALGPAPPPRSLTVLDLGCGTGLCGRQFRDWAATLVGVDLSANMLAKAHERGIYDELIRGDLLVPLQQSEGRFDLILASDVLLYLGELEPVLLAVHRARAPGGRFAFTIDIREGPDYQLLPFGHYAHSRAYLQQVTANTHLQEVCANPATFPREGGQDAAGLVVVLSHSPVRQPQVESCDGERGFNQG